MRPSPILFTALGFSALLVACGSSDSADLLQPWPADGPGVFESDSPNGDPSGPNSGSGGSSGAAGAGSGGGNAGGAGGDGAQKTIEEADIVQIENNRLYALSRYSGLSVIDITQPDAMQVLGRFNMEGTPFEMYVKDGMVHAMYSSLRTYKQTSSGWSTDQTSGVLTLNAKDPTAIKKLTEYEIPGEISDSRKVDNILYVVSYENGYCYGCRETESTTVLSLDVSQPSAVVKVDELAFSSPSKTYSWGKRSIMVTPERIYIAGREWNGDEASNIQIVDIADAKGSLVKGASFQAAGSIESRWQLDEKNGFLRVVSQPGSWQIAEPPRMTTFQVHSSQSVTKLADVKMVLPEPERLRSARFDGDRAYAITFRQTDPLFVLDFSDPKSPKQLGELEIPGWVYHMEPRGDRLLALGFDQGNKEGSLNVSLFDVADMTAPKMLSRVHFGGTSWGNFAEDQNRIHKAFSIYDALGLIFVPYSGHSYNEGNYGCSNWHSGVQIVSFDKDSLKKRGDAAAQGQARRALLHQKRLLAVSDVAVESFDIDNLDAPKSKDDVRLANISNKTAVVGTRVARLSAHWWNTEPTLDVTTVAGAEDPQPLDSINLKDVFTGSKNCGYEDDYYYYYDASYELYSDGELAYVLRLGQSAEVAAIDISGKTAVVRGVAKLPSASSGPGYYNYGGYGGNGLVDAGAHWVGVGKRLAFLRVNYDYGAGKLVQATVDFADFTTPSAPQVYGVTLPESLGFTGLHAAGSAVVLSRWIASPTTANKVRFYAERIEAGAGAPKRLTPINVPGSVFATDGAAKNLLTMDYSNVEEKLGYQQCIDKWGYGGIIHVDKPYGYGEKDPQASCIGVERTIKHVSLGEKIATQNSAKLFPRKRSVAATAVGSDRVFASAYCYDCSNTGGSSLLVVAGLSSGKIAISETTLGGSSSYFYANTLIAQGTRAVVAGGYPAELMTVDASNAAAPKLSDPVALGGYSVGHVALHGDRALCSLGQFGARWVDLP